MITGKCVFLKSDGINVFLKKAFLTTNNDAKQLIPFADWFKHKSQTLVTQSYVTVLLGFTCTLSLHNYVTTLLLFMLYFHSKVKSEC